MSCSFIILAASCVNNNNTEHNDSEMRLDTVTSSFNIKNNKVYDFVKVGNSTWMQKNWDGVTFRNGDSILNARTSKEWIDAVDNRVPAWCFYDNSKELGGKYGILYNWYALSDDRSLAPEGWQLPQKEDWQKLTKYPYINAVTVRGKGLESFSVENMEKAELKFLAGGIRSYNSETEEMVFEGIKCHGDYWIFDTIKDEEYRPSVKFPTSLRTFLPDNKSIYYGLSVRFLKEDTVAN